MTCPTPRPGVLDVSPYVGGESTLPGVTRVIKLASNEGALGPSPKAVAAAAGSADSICRYPDGDAAQLRQALAAHHGLDPARITCGAGSDELLAVISRAYLGPGDEMLYSRHGFLMYAIVATGLGAKPVAAPENNLTVDVDALLAKVTDRTRVVFIANPNNPTGTYLPFSEVRRLHAGLPKSVLLVLDAAYAEYMTATDYRAGIELVDESENVVMTRTFSKLYALGGLRLGWCYGPRGIIDALNRVRGPFNVTTPAMMAGIAAMTDGAFADKVRDHTIRWRQWTTESLRRLGLEVPHSVANFILARFADGAEANAADQFLRKHGLIARKIGGYGLPESLRITIGTEEEMRILVGVLGDFVKQHRGAPALAGTE
jgi:histidinol-phosphate aminotransferase